MINNILYLNEKLFVFGISTTFCFFCNPFSENITYLFCDCTIAISWEKLQLKLKDNITLLPLTSWAALPSLVFLKPTANLVLSKNMFFSF